ncbi:hypothetical protein VTJ04DRAFT_5231 [Mycothermus thermophilus]|uniref:uncharacterized protein n=1 Tax=Humicola insolens TaxID=85995 RepID=UPI003742D358
MREFGVELSPNIFSPNGYRLQLSEAERAQIFSLRRANVPVAKIADDFHVSRQTVYRVFEEVQDRNSYAQKPGRGRKKSLSDRQARLVTILVKKNPHTPWKDLCQHEDLRACLQEEWRFEVVGLNRGVGCQAKLSR